MRSPFIALAVVPVAVLFLTGCPADDRSGDPAPAPDPAPSPTIAAGDLPEGVTVDMVEQGRAIFHGPGICFTCHGQDGVGTQLGPAMTDQEWLHLQQGSYQEIVQIIATGVQQPRQYASVMPPFGGAQLDEGQHRAVAAYVYALSRGLVGQ